MMILKMVEMDSEMWYDGCATVVDYGFFYCLNFDNIIVIIRVFEALLIDTKSLTATVASAVKQVSFNRAFFIGPYTTKNPLSWRGNLSGFLVKGRA